MSKGGILFAKLDPFFFQNRKVIRAGRNGRDVFLFALCMNAQRGALGWIPVADLEPWYVARQLGVSEAEATIGINEAESAGLLYADGDQIILCGWTDEWARRAKTRAEIQADYRKRNRKGIDTDHQRYRDEVTSDDSSNALPIDQRDRSERETAVTRGASLSLPGDYEPSEQARTIAADRRLDLAFELAQFRDYVASKGNKPSTDWDASFRGWLRKSKDVDRAKDSSGAGSQVTAKTGPFVTRQNVGGSPQWVLSELDGNARVVSDEEARKYPGYKQLKQGGAA